MGIQHIVQIGMYDRKMENAVGSAERYVEL